ncbi:MAG: hypothetical protein AB7J35_03975 [Dehalococcoidia bacterium]
MTTFERDLQNAGNVSGVVLMNATSSAEWLRSRNLSADQTGSIHDDDRARSLGFKAALIGGSVHSAFVTKRAVELFGPQWYERGFMKQAYIQPLYESDEFQIVTDELKPGEFDERLHELAFETRAGVRTTAGFFGLARSAESAVAPWMRPESQDPESEKASLAAEFSRAISVEESSSRRELTGDDSEWYRRSSPWGGAIVPSFMYMLLGSAGSRQEARESLPQAGMNSVWQLLQKRPMLAGRSHRISVRVVQSGQSERSAFRTTEMTVRTEEGDVVAQARQKIRWLLPK